MNRNGIGRDGRGTHSPAAVPAPAAQQGHVAAESTGRRDDRHTIRSPGGLVRAGCLALVVTALVAGVAGCTGSGSGTGAGAGTHTTPTSDPGDPEANGGKAGNGQNGQSGAAGANSGGTEGDRTAPRTERDVADPVRLRIPAIGVSTRVIALRLDDQGRLVAPRRYDVAGWNRSGPEPGETGAAVVAAHVDSRPGPAVFFRLRELDPGDRVHVERADGSTATFTVRRLARYPKSGIPDREVYGDTPRPELRLITCGGTFDQSRRSYRDNVIAFAD